MSRELMQQRIEQAQIETEQKKEMVQAGPMRQHYHFMPQTGWLNDPNGLIFYKGKYHFFFQWNPYSGFWDFMHWGHAVSEDLLHWEYLPLALAPSEEYDDYRKGGCFSGSAIVHEGKLFLMYTGVTNRGSGNIQTQCIAYSEDGIHFEKYEGNPVILPPEGVDGQHFRDPKIWKHKDSYYMVCGASCNNRAQALLYRSEDMLHWTYVNVLAESRGEWGYMWECPDFYPLEDKYVLMCSPMGAGDRKAVYFVGDFDYDTGRFDWDLSGEIDWGMDFYAPQSFEAPDGRRLIAAWANEWECMPFWKDWGPTYREGWCGFFNLLREVRMLPDHTLQFVPVKELQKLREEECCEDRIELGDAEEKELRAGDGISFEMQFAIDLEETQAEKIELDLRCGEGRQTRCMIDLRQGTLSVDRSRADGWSAGVSRSVLFLKGKKELDIHVFSDQSSVEIFADQYQNNHANNIYAGNGQNKILIRAAGGRAVIRGYRSYGLKECFR
nr:glycoside hydrolase family 32 protein [Massilistercora timonensis]